MVLFHQFSLETVVRVPDLGDCGRGSWGESWQLQPSWAEQGLPALTNFS